MLDTKDTEYFDLSGQSRRMDLHALVLTLA